MHRQRADAGLDDERVDIDHRRQLEVADHDVDASGRAAQDGQSLLAVRGLEHVADPQVAEDPDERAALEVVVLDDEDAEPGEAHRSAPLPSSPSA